MSSKNKQATDQSIWHCKVKIGSGTFSLWLHYKCAYALEDMWGEEHGYVKFLKRVPNRKIRCSYCASRIDDLKTSFGLSDFTYQKFMKDIETRVQAVDLRISDETIKAIQQNFLQNEISPPEMTPEQTKAWYDSLTDAQKTMFFMQKLITGE